MRFALVAFPWILAAQIPSAEALSPADAEGFREEIQRLERLRQTAGDQCTVTYALARTWAAGGQFPKAFDTLEKVAELKVGLDPANDEVFKKLKDAKEYRGLLERIRADTPPIVKSTPAFIIQEPDLAPEGIAYDARRKRFFLGSTLQHRIITCSDKGVCRTLVRDGQDGLGEVLGLRVDPRDSTLWAAANSSTESGVFHYDGSSGKLIRKYSIGRTGHLFNDLVVDKQGRVFVTDSAAGTVYWISSEGLRVFNEGLKVEAANGIALADGPSPRLYVAGFPDGVTVVDITSRTFHALWHPAGLCLATIDGLYYSHGDLLAIQNGIMTHRIVRFHLSRDAIDGFEMLERRNPSFDGGPTTGALAGNHLYYVANPQLDKAAAHQPLQVLRLSLSFGGRK